MMNARCTAAECVPVAGFATGQLLVLRFISIPSFGCAVPDNLRFGNSRGRETARDGAHQHIQYSPTGETIEFHCVQYTALILLLLAEFSIGAHVM